MLSIAKITIAVSAFASVALAAPQWGTGFSGPVVGGLEILQSGIKEKQRKEAEEATGINLRWYQGGSGPSHLGIRMDDGWYGYNKESEPYLPCHTEDCLYRNEGNPDTAWCLYEDLCCNAANHFEPGCQHIGVDPNDRNNWCAATGNSYGTWDNNGQPNCWH